MKKILSFYFVVHIIEIHFFPKLEKIEPAFLFLMLNKCALRLHDVTRRHLKTGCLTTSKIWRKKVARSGPTTETALRPCSGGRR